MTLYRVTDTNGNFRYNFRNPLNVTRKQDNIVLVVPNTDYDDFESWCLEEKGQWPHEIENVKDMYSEYMQYLIENDND